jgi:N-acylneuraminate cytidylyltransferase
MNVAVIPARYGSKRIKKKNIRLFCGQPIIAYSIQQALKSGVFDRVIVSTDNDEIATIAKKYGAEVPFIRPQELSGDFVGTVDVVNHAIHWLEENGEAVDYVCCIYPTAPFIRVRDIKEGLEILKNDIGKIFSFTVTTFPFPIQRALRIIKDRQLEAFWPENIEKRSQDLEESYHDAGQFYWGKVVGFLEKKTIFAKHSFPIVLPRSIVQDIDTEEDWSRAELMFMTNKSLRIK